MIPTKEEIFSSLDAAKENGYFDPDEYLDGATPLEVANDMLAYDAACEDCLATDILPFVKEWFEERGIK